jgi:hypothetical protein
MAALTKTQILESKSTLEIKRVPVPEWGDGAFVFVRELSGDERDAYDQKMYQVNQSNDFRGSRSTLVAMALCDEEGSQMGFTPAEVEQLGKKSGAAIDRIFEVVKDLSGLSGKAVEEAEKN